MGCRLAGAARDASRRAGASVGSTLCGRGLTPISTCENALDRSTRSAASSTSAQHQRGARRPTGAARSAARRPGRAAALSPGARRRVRRPVVHAIELPARDPAPAAATRAASRAARSTRPCGPATASRPGRCGGRSAASGRPAHLQPPKDGFRVEMRDLRARQHAVGAEHQRALVVELLRGHMDAARTSAAPRRRRAAGRLPRPLR